MSLHGVRQLKELIVRYSDLDGSSKGVRGWMRTSLVPLALGNPEVEIKTELKRSHHPFLRGTYKNGNSKTICIRNLPEEEIQKYALFLRNQIGRKVNYSTHLQMHFFLIDDVAQPMVTCNYYLFSFQISNNGYKRPIVSMNTSIQGEWHERMDLIPLEFIVTHHN